MSLVLQPKNYLDFITNYKRILSTQRKEILDTTARLSNGLTKLTQVSSEVDVLQQELSKAKVVVEAATRECNELLKVRPIPSSWVIKLRVLECRCCARFKTGFC
jgi:hypothetical protein